METMFDMAQRHVLDARKIVERQRELIARKGAHHQDTTEAQELLVRFEKTLAMFEEHLAELTGRKRPA
jgi:hypothetical protein